MPEFVSREAVPSLLQGGQNIFVQGANGEPSVVLAALKKAGDRHPGKSGVHYCGVFVPGLNHWDPASFSANDTMTAFFATPELRPSIDQGTTRLIPLHYSSIEDYLQKEIRFDVLLIQVSPPDRNRMCNLGVSVDFVPTLLEGNATVIAEINASMPVSNNSPSIPLDRIDYAVEVNHPLVEPPESKNQPEGDTLSRYVASLIKDGDTIETGVGKQPSAILEALRDKNDLGFHSGLISAPVLSLIENGNINGSRKSIDKGVAVTGVAYGPQKFYEAMALRDDISFRPVSYTHNIGTLRKLENFVAINSAIEVDLFGQVNTEFVNDRQVSGVGGLVDFMRGARVARNGRSIIAIPAKAGSKGKSRIVPLVRIATCSRNDVDYVVTEYGIASLRNKTARERAEALISIAAPEFRDELGQNIS